MDAIEVKNQDGMAIRHVEDWRKLAAPKKADLHWKTGRSAMEEALAWFSVPTVPPELQNLLDGHEVTKGFTVETVVPEKVTKLDSFNDEHRNHDVVVSGTVAGKKAVVCIEAKADEEFGKIAGDYTESAYRNNHRSNVPARFELICDRLFGGASDEAKALRYRS